MDFQKKQWQFNDIISETELNRMEDGIEEGIAKAEDAKTSIESHENRQDNPHNVTKQQVGLGNVDNVKQASKAEFDAYVADIASQEVGKGASLIGSSDSGNYYNSTNVEGQLQEIGARLSTFRNAVIREFTFFHPDQSGERVVRLTGHIAGQVLITKPRIQQDFRQFLTALYAVGISIGLPEIYEVYKINFDSSWNVIPDSSNEGEILFTFPDPQNSSNVHLLFIGSGNPVFEMVGD